MITNIELISLLIGQLLLASWLMWRRPYHPLSIVGLLTAVFSYLPAVLLLGGTGFQSYSWRNFRLIDLNSAADAALLIGVLNLCLLIGAFAAELSRNNGFIQENSTPLLAQSAFLFKSKKLSLISALYFALWLALAVVQYRGSDQTITQFFLPIKQTGITAVQSGYVRSLYLAIPSALVVISYWRDGRLRLIGWTWVAIALLATFSTHQRRELVTTALLILSLHIFLRPLRDSTLRGRIKQNTDHKLRTSRMRWGTLTVLFAGLMLVPLLWYARVYFTSRSRGSAVNAFEVRSFSDVLLGSPSTGFPTFVYIQDFVDTYGTNVFYLFAYPFTIFIPRVLWESKPTDLDTMMQDNYWLAENPSSFWYGEVYYTFGSFAPIVTLVLAFVMYRFCLKCQNLPDVWYRTIAAILFTQSVTLFKNGITVFIIETAVLIVLLGCAWIVCRPAEYRSGSRPPPHGTVAAAPVNQVTKLSRQS